jgi:hypothetical protein
MYQSGDFECGDSTALITYVYGECDAAEQAAIDAHLAVCPACAGEIASLRDTRTHLSAWAPPAAELGFQIVGPQHAAGAVNAEANILTPVRWWSRPLPAWAQVAAAAAIFVSGVLLGAARQPQAVPAQARSATIAATPGPTPAAVSPEDLQSLEQRLRDEIGQVRHTAAVAPAPRRGDEDVLRQVRALIADSEQRQRRELAMRTATVMSDVDTQRRLDLAQVQRTVGQIQDVTGAAIRDQNRMVNYLVNVSQRR